MNIDEIFKETFQADFNSRLPLIKQEILEFLNSNPTSICITRKSNCLDDILARKKDPNFIPSFFSKTEEGINISMMSDELIDFIIANIPKSVESLTIPAEVLEKYPTCLKYYQNLKHLGIPNYSWELTTDEINTYIEGTNITSIDASNITIKDIENLSKSNYATSTMRLTTKINNVLLKCRYNTFDKEINLVTPITEDGLSFIPENYFDDDISFVNILVNGKKVVSKGTKDVTVLLSDNALETKEFITMLLNRTTTKPKKLTLVAQNKTYDNLSELKSLEDICNIEIEYGYNEKASIDQFEVMRATLDYYKSLILQNDLSASERICYAYDLIKSNVYKEYEEEKLQARKIHSIIETGSIVCVGYSIFLAELLKEVGVKAHAISTSVPLDDGSIAGHERNLIEVNDEKYGINGIYAFDCTWDSNSDTYKVNRNGEEKIVREPEPTDEIIKKYDPMSRYSYFFIPSDEYNLYFPGERKFENVSEWNGKEYNPNELGLSELPKRSSETETLDVYNTNGSIPDETIMEIIYNTRLFEGYSQEVNQELLSEIEEIRRLKAPKALRAEEGMTK